MASKGINAAEEGGSDLIAGDGCGLSAQEPAVRLDGDLLSNLYAAEYQACGVRGHLQSGHRPFRLRTGWLGGGCDRIATYRAGLTGREAQQTFEVAAQ